MQKTLPQIRTDNEARFPVGTQYRTRDKRKALCAVVDIWRTYNEAGKMVRLRYVVRHQFMGQTITDPDVIDTTIAMALAAEAAD